MACIGPFWGLSLRFFSSTIIPGLCDSARLGSFNLLKNTFPPIFAPPKIQIGITLGASWDHPGVTFLKTFSRLRPLFDDLFAPPTSF